MYRPLDYAAKANLHAFCKEDVKNNPAMEDEEAVISFLLSDNYGNPAYNGKFKEINNLAFLTVAYNWYGSQTSLRDTYESFYMMATMNRWNKSKQVLQIDDDFIYALAETKNGTIIADIYDKLPFHTFCIDMNKNNGKYFADYDLVYITVDKILPEKSTIVTIIRVYPEHELFFVSQVILNGNTIITDKNNISLYPYSIKNYRSEADKDYLHICETIDTTKQIRNLKYDNTQTANFNVFVLQLLQYMVVKNIDIAESAITKSTYRPIKPGAKPKNKFSEVREWNVGYTIGPKLKKYNNKGERGEKGSSCTSKRPHYRRAHFTHVWTGPRNTEQVLESRWIEPIFVNANSSNDILPSIHKIKI